MKAPGLQLVSDPGTLRQKAEERLGAAKKQAAPPTLEELQSAVQQLQVYEAELEIQNEELRQAQLQLEESNKRYFRHFDLAPVGLLRLNRIGMILEANILAARMLGLDRMQLRHRNFLFILQVASDSRATFMEHFELAFANLQMEACEILLRVRDGVETFVRMQSVQSTGTGDSNDLLVTLTDLTERREIEQVLTHQKLSAESARLDKEHFFAMLSHELRTPLTPVLAALDELDSSPDRSAEDLAVFAMMRRNLELETHLIDDLLDLTRITSGKFELHRQNSDVHVCLEHAVDVCRAEIEAKKLQFTIDLRAPRHFAHVDAGRMQQVFWNLIKNAVKFTPAGASVAVESRCDSVSEITVEVRDTGIGIDWWTLGRVFDPFFQAHLSMQRRFGGLGLGLAISKSIVEAHGGLLTAISDGPGTGSTFRVDLSTVCPAGAKELERAAAKPAPRARRRVRLLLVEDHNDTRQVLERLLRRRGYEVEAAGDPALARAFCAEKKFDLLISDIGLPEISGLDLFKELNLEHGLPGIAMSGFGSDSDIAASKAAGFVEHLIKPVDVQRLDDAIQRIAADRGGMTKDQGSRLKE
ncbi:MAG: ATP-binding protein [Verrucomicrobiota bacterium]|nr:ATP-binding protein [Verrucomicrobiota bacterium]